MEIWKLNVINDKSLDVARRVAARHVKRGWMVNPDDKMLRLIFDCLIIQGGVCHNGKECPCADYLKRGDCRGELYVKTNYNAKEIRN